MHYPKSWFAATLAATLCLLPLGAGAQDYGDDQYRPHSGQDGKDVIWVPTPNSLIDRMLDMAKLTARDIHYDLGSGDGRTVIAAAKRGARAYGVEFNPDMVSLSQRSAKREGVADRATFINGDIFKTDFSKATVLTLYLLPSLNLKLRPTILQMKPGTRVVSHAFTMDDWQPDQTASVEGRTAYLWIVPARVEGSWQWHTAEGGKRTYELALRQTYQQVTGTVKVNGRPAQISNAKLDGEHISFAVVEQAGGKAVNHEFSGRVNGTTITGAVKHSGGEEKWSAARTDAR